MASFARESPQLRASQAQSANKALHGEVRAPDAEQQIAQLQDVVVKSKFSTSEAKTAAEAAQRLRDGGKHTRCAGGALRPIQSRARGAAEGRRRADQLRGLRVRRLPVGDSGGGVGRLAYFELSHSLR